MGSLGSPPVLLTLFGLLLTPVLVVRKVPGALILSIAALTLIGFVVPGAGGKMVTTRQLPCCRCRNGRPTRSWRSISVICSRHILITLPILFYFVCAEFFSTLGTLIGVTGAADLRRPDGSIPNATAAFATDATASIVGPLLGTSVVTAYIELVTGVQAGGRTGLTPLTVAALFVLALFFWPVFVIIPPQATAPALVLVGVLMLQGLARTDMTDLVNAVPIVLTLLVTVPDEQSHQRDGARHAELHRAAPGAGAPRRHHRRGLGAGCGVHRLFLRDRPPDVTQAGPPAFDPGRAPALVPTLPKLWKIRSQAIAIRLSFRMASGSGFPRAAGFSRAQSSGRRTKPVQPHGASDGDIDVDEDGGRQ